VVIRYWSLVIGHLVAASLAGCAIPEKPVAQKPRDVPVAQEKPAPPAEPAKPAEPAPPAVEPAAAPAKLHPLLVQAYGEINASDGIDQSEAEVIADTYFDLYISGNGMANGVTDKGATWEVATFIDYDMRPWEPIQVDKKTGTMACKGYPTVSPAL
jgi:hypothetical protein